MSRLPEQEDEPNAVWHITGRVNWQAWHLERPEAFEMFIEQLGRALKSFDVDLLGYVGMSNHYHLAARCPDENRYRQLTSRRTRCRHIRPWPRGHFKSSVIAQCMQKFKFNVSRRLQKDLGLSGHLWDGPHHRGRILDASALVAVVAYDHRNPVVQKMVLRPEAYTRSSAAWWAGAGLSHLPLATRPDFPFGMDIDDFRERLNRHQQDKRLDEVMGEFYRSRLRIDSPKGRALLLALLEAAGLECGSAAAPVRTQPFASPRVATTK